MAASELVSRLNKLGFRCEEVPLDRLVSATAALACMPMYAVANSHGWTSESHFKLPLLDVEGFEGIRESWAIGREEAGFELNKEDRRVLGLFLKNPRPSDSIVYDYAFALLADFLDLASAKLASELRVAVARSCVNVAKAAGKGIFGTGEKVSEGERASILVIADVLDLGSNADAAAILETLDQARPPAP